MKVVILGASGMLGSMLTAYLSQFYDLIATVRDKQFIKPLDGVDWREFDALKRNGDYLVKLLDGSHWIINAIGIIPQRYDGQVAGPTFFATNGWFPRRLATVAESLSVPVIQVATDCVFSGHEGRYVENSAIDPLDDAYALSKSQGEYQSPKVHHIRCSIVGPEYHGKSLLGWFLGQPQGSSVPGFTNHRWNGVTTLAFAKVCQGVIDRNIDLPHCQHLVPADAVSKAQLLGYFAEYFDRQDITVKAQPSPVAADRTLATTSQALNDQLWKAAGYVEIPTIREMVRELGEYVKGGRLK